MFRIFVNTGTNLIVIVIREYTTYVKYIYLIYFLRSNARMIANCCTLFSNLSFQMSYSDWPSDIFPGDFYKTYILGMPYQYHYAFLKNLSPYNASDVDLLLAERLVKKNFLSIDILTCLAMQELQVTEKIPLASYVSQLGGAPNSCAGITVVVVVELVELLYYFLAKKSQVQVSQWWRTLRALW